MTRIRRIARWERIFFITFNVAEGVAPLVDQERNVVLEILDMLRGKLRFLVLGFVVMPDHAHLLLRVTDVPIERIMRDLKSRSGFLIGRKRGKSGAVWQRSYFDFICRKAKDVVSKLEYIHQNPVKAELVTEGGDWRWSSFGHYAKSGKPMIPVDFLDLSGDAERLLWPAPW